MSLIGFHSRPDDATAEIGHLKDVISRVQTEFGSDSEVGLQIIRDMTGGTGGN